jgi:hypothetical protein
MLSSLLGTREETALAGAVGTYAGMDRHTGDSLLGMLAPVVMGTIAQQQGGRNVDGRGIAGFFAGQRDSIAAALPSGFSNLLGGTGLLDSLRGSARVSERAVYPSHPAVGAARPHPESASSAMSWLFWAVMAAAIAALLFYVLRPAQNVVDRGVGTVQSVMVDGRNLGNEVTSSMDMLRSTLTGITDVASAQRALPRLQDIAMQVDGISNSMTQLTMDQRRAMREMVSPSMQGLNRLASSASAMPGVSDVIGPTLNGIMTKLRAIAG